MNPSTNEIVGLEKQFWDAMKKNDVDAAVRLTRFPCTVAGPMGARRVEEKEFRQMMSSQKPEQFEGIEIQNPQVEMLNEETALITYSIDFNKKKMLDVSTWIRSGDTWLCAYHAETPIRPH